MHDFTSFFERANTSPDGQARLTPYPYQTRFATADELPHLLRVPTSAGKTAAAILGWLFRQQTRPLETPRRLVYCLPMRVLVEQTEREARRWIGNLGLDVPVHQLMGGADATDWYLGPEQPAILIGTQDMLLSRALNRGYAASRFHWPIDFGLLNNDCLWVFDEPQLMGNGVSTSAQLAGLRQSLGTVARCESVWMSATLEPAWLDTVDFRGKFTCPPLELSDEDYAPDRPLFGRMTAAKTLRPLSATSSKDMKDVGRALLGLGDQPRVHQAGTQTVVVVNTVDRAKALYEELLKLRRKSPTPGVLLIHSRFRPTERQRLNERLQEPGQDRVVVATQVVEAGVDISARTLVTELAPWSSLVQRMGRCNRTGNDGPGTVYWIDLEEKLSAPYGAEELSFARDQLGELRGQSVSPRDLEQFKTRVGFTLPFEHTHVLRRRDLLDLFDTAPDLSGNDIDIQRFVRGSDPETDVQVFWRKLDHEPPGAEEPAPHRDELCSVPVRQIQDFLDSQASKSRRRAGYVWDHLDEAWVRLDPQRVRPGMTILLPDDLGGYDWDHGAGSGQGWHPGSSVPVGVRQRNGLGEEGPGSDPLSAFPGPPLTIAQHTEHVCAELSGLLAALPIDKFWRDCLVKSARWHDLGKAHAAFQQAMQAANPSLASDQHWAKSGVRARLRHGRRHFRHELASALAAWQQGLPFAVAYLVASHHGRVRLAIRALPTEDPPSSPDTLYAMGVHHGDTLDAVSLGTDSSAPLSLDLTPMQLGGERSWTAHALELLADVGPFRLACFESLLRVADMRASKQEAEPGLDNASEGEPHDSASESSLDKR